MGAQRQTRSKRSGGERTKSCFCCFIKGRRCRPCSPDGPCLRCRHKHNDTTSLQPIPSLPESELGAILDDFVRIPRQINLNASSVLHVMVDTKDKNDAKTERKYKQITISEPFFPDNHILCTQMDSLVHEMLSLQKEGTDPTSRLVEDASLAGGYLALLFPTAEMSRTSNSLAVSLNSDEVLECHMTKFSLIRFEQLLDPILAALRRISLAPSEQNNSPSERNNSLNAIAAAGVLWFELEDINQRFQLSTARLLCAHPKLESVLRYRLKMASQEILDRIQRTCGQFPWAKNLVPPCKRARRDFHALDISLEMNTNTTPKPTLFIQKTYVGTFHGPQSTSTTSGPPPTKMPLGQTPCMNNYQSRIHDTTGEDSMWSPSPISKGAVDSFWNNNMFPEPSGSNSLFMNSGQDLDLHEFGSSINSTTNERFHIDSQYPHLDDFGMPMTRNTNQQLYFGDQYPTSINYHSFVPRSPLGVGDDHATSSALQVPGTSYYLPGETEWFTPHVSGPLPFSNGTREETSVVTPGDLFPPVLQPRLR